MVPKKLTDCPENLRESIDWLIQVKNGGDGDGLGKLADALKMLIDKAIADAFTADVDPLLNVINPACGKSDNCMSTFEEIEKLKKQVNESGKVEKHQFEKLLQYIEEHGTEYKRHHYADPSREKVLEGVKAKLSEIDELRKYLETFTNDPNDLISNVCTGLETFLGFDPKSKGYNGKGIVYSDLDRLADAVMAFLYGVLSYVSEKQPYNVGKTELKKFVDGEHKRTLCSGHLGFQQVMPEVVRKVGEYNKEVERSNRKVKSKITTLQQSFDVYFTRKVSGINENFDPRFPTIINDTMASMKSILEECIRNAKKFNDDLDIETNPKDINSAINDFNNKLRDRINIVRQTMKLETEHLTALSTNQTKVLEEMTAKIASSLSALRTKLDRDIDAKIPLLVSKLREKVRSIKKQLEVIGSDLGRYVVALELWIEKTQRFIHEVREKDLENILNEVNESLTSKKYPIEEAVKQLNKTTKGLTSYIEEQVKPGLTALLAEAGKEFDIIKNGVKKGFIRDGGVDLSIEHNWRKLHSTIVGLVDGLINKTQMPDKDIGKLQAIVNKVGNYVRNFGNNLGNAVQHWVEEIVKGEAVSGLLSTYVKNNTDIYLVTGSLKGSSVGEVCQELSPIIQQKIKIALSEIKMDMHPQTKPSVDENLSEIVRYLRNYSTHVMDKTATTVSYVEIALTGDGKFSLARPETFRSNLQAAVQTALSAVKSAAVGAADEIDTFREQSQIKNLTEVIKSVSLIEYNFNTGLLTGSSGGMLDVALSRVTKAIDNHEKYIVSTSDEKSIKQRIEGIVVDHITKSLDGLSANIIQHIETLSDAVSRSTNVVREKIFELQNKRIGNTYKRGKVEADSMQEIHRKLQELHNSLETGPIGATENFIQTESNQLQNQYINELKQQVRQEVENAAAKLTTQAKKHHVSTIKLLLKQFAARVTKELDGLPQQIEADRHIGFKGFMEKFYGDHTKAPKADNIDKLKNATNKKNVRDLSEAFRTFFEPLKEYINGEITRANRENQLRKHPSIPESQNYYHETLDGVHNELTKLLHQINAGNRYDHHVPRLLDGLTDAINGLHPESFSEPNTPLLDCVGQGLVNLVQELRNTYISTYDGAEWEPDNSAKYAKVLVTISRMLFHDLFKVKRVIENPNNTLKGYKMYTSVETSFSLCDIFFNNHGYDASSPANAQYGELNHKDDFTGESVLTHLTKDENGNHLFKSDGTPDGTLYKLFGYVETYYDFCNLLPTHNPKHPCNVFEMLVWMSGLVHNPAYKKLKQHINEMIEFEKDVKLRTLIDTAWSVNLPSVSTYCYPVLVGITGHGDAATYYGCQYLNNSFNLYYPPDGAQCFDMLLDVLRKLFPVFQFLNTQCKMNLKQHGWRDCVYGKDVGSSNWKCTDHSTTKPDCQSTSPLMSYLNDCLPGHLPHQLQSVGCMPKCSTCSPSSPNMPCLIPLGFRAFSGSTKTGKYLSSLLGKICGDNGVLTDLYSALTCLEGRPPKTFPDIFSFYYNLTRSWKLMRPSRSQVDPMQQAICDEITGTVACDYDVAKSFLQTCRFLYESSSHFMHEKHLGSDLSYLVGCGNEDCGYFINPLDSVGYSVFASKHAYKYLSWLIYCASDLVRFFEQLKSSFCNISCADYGCSHCLNSEDCLNGKHGTAKCGCKSMVDCKGVLPTFYSYGIIFQNASNRRSKSCYEFNEAINGIFKSGVLTRTLQAIDAFLFAIRTPFVWTVVALWSLSLLYLFYVLIGRLDTLHIKSHLRSPASYKIAAQSLLAAARVGKLAKISYLQA